MRAGRPGCRWARRPRPGTFGPRPCDVRLTCAPRVRIDPRLDGVVALIALPNSVVASEAVPDAGARPFATRTSLPGATRLAVVPTLTSASLGSITARPPRGAGP